MTIKRAKVIELVGLAGAGKSTIARTLARSSSRVVVGKEPYFRRASDIPYLAWGALALLPTFLRLNSGTGGGGWSRKQNLIWMVTLLAWQQRLRHSTPRGERLVVLDQGPVYLLMMLHLLGPEALRGPDFEIWWSGVCGECSELLDTVIWLDAADASLVERIRARDRWHGVKEKSDNDAFEYFERCRSSFRHVLLSVSNNGHPRVLELDTTHTGVDEIVERLLLEYGV